MNNDNWNALRTLLMADGWKCRDDADAVFAPRESLWLRPAPDEEQDYQHLHDRMAEILTGALDDQDFKSDVASLVAALDTFLKGN